MAQIQFSSYCSHYIGYAIYDLADEHLVTDFHPSRTVKTIVQALRELIKRQRVMIENAV